MYKVFVNNNPVFFIENGENILNSDLLFSCNDEKEFELVIEKSKNNEEPIYARVISFKKTLDLFSDRYKLVEAAGGLVVNKNDEILFICRNGFWDLPKGKIEEGEDVAISAIREVEEECGISQPIIEKKLLTTYHTYDTYGEDCLKPTHWYLMRYDGDEELIPQVEEGITKVEWVKKENLAEKLENTFGSITDVIEEFIKTKS